MDRPWALLVWGIVTFILYTFVVIAGLDRWLSRPFWRPLLFHRWFDTFPKISEGDRRGPWTQRLASVFAAPWKYRRRLCLVVLNGDFSSLLSLSLSLLGGSQWWFLFSVIFIFISAWWFSMVMSLLCYLYLHLWLVVLNGDFSSLLSLSRFISAWWFSMTISLLCYFYLYLCLVVLNGDVSSLLSLSLSPLLGGSQWWLLFSVIFIFSMVISPLYYLYPTHIWSLSCFARQSNSQSGTPAPLLSKL